MPIENLLDLQMSLGSLTNALDRLGDRLRKASGTIQAIQVLSSETAHRFDELFNSLRNVENQCTALRAAFSNIAKAEQSFTSTILTESGRIADEIKSSDGKLDHLSVEASTPRTPEAAPDAISSMPVSKVTIVSKSPRRYTQAASSSTRKPIIQRYKEGFRKKALQITLKHHGLTKKRKKSTATS